MSPVLLSLCLAFATPASSLLLAPASFLPAATAAAVPVSMAAPAVARPFVTRVAVTTSAAFATAVVIPVKDAIQRKLNRFVL